jgi:ABC-type branched-subunit amino acid transport system ATPase component/ABC-type branched-subunit amino acid transport system permease subunit
VPENTLSYQGLRQKYMLTLALAALYLVATAFVENTYFRLILALIPIWACMGVSWNIFSGYSGLLSFGHAAFFGLGGYAVAILFVFLGVTPWIGMLVGAGAGGLAGLLIGVPTFRLRGVYFSLAMLAYPLSMLYVFEYLGLHELAMPMKRENAWAYMQFDDQRIYVLLATLMLVGFVILNLRLGRSRFGLSLLAIKQNELAAQASGINPFRWKLLALVISGALAGLAGALYAVLMVIVTPHSAFGMLVSAQALIFSMFGGVGTVAGPIVGAVILIPLSELLSSTVGKNLPGIQGVIYGVAIIAVIMLAPQGLLTWIAERRSPRMGSLIPTHNAPDAAAEDFQRAPVKTATRKTGPVLLRVNGISRNYGGLMAVDNTSFEVFQGEILGIIGPNGAGKTTLFNLLNGIVEPSAGTVEFNGSPITGLQPFKVCRLGIGRTFQVARPFSRLNVMDNVVIGALATEPNNDKAYEIARQVLELVGLHANAAQLAGNLTAVQLRLMEVARALACKPRLLLLDEVLAGLGGQEVEQVLHVLYKLSGSGITIVIIEHTMHAMVRLADRLLVLDHGRVLTIGDPLEVTSSPDVIEAYLGKKWMKNVAN